MGLKDFLITPIIIGIVYLLAYLIRPVVTDGVTRKYFIPGLSVKIFSAIALGLVYFYYYGYGDTINYHTHGSRHIWEAFLNSPMKAFKLLLASGEYYPETFKYASKIKFYDQSSSYMVVRFAGFFDLFTFGTYSATAVLFSALSFSGIWAMFTVFYSKFKKLHLYFAVSILFIPSVVFWGSGILKDTLTLASIGWAMYGIDLVFFKKTKITQGIVILFVALYLTYVIKIYILLSFLPAVLVWIVFERVGKLKTVLSKTLATPIILLIAVVLSYWLVMKIGESDPKYAIENIGRTAQITAYDIAFQTGRYAGSTYTLGDLDGTFLSVLKLAPAAINVSLFRPYLWEISTPFMLLAALESLFVFVLTLYVFYKTRFMGFFVELRRPIVLFCIIFSMVFAFAVGASTFNFGTLMRYKIPMMPFYISAMFIILHSYKKGLISKATPIVDGRDTRPSHQTVLKNAQ